jgi:hypothetical protein
LLLLSPFTSSARARARWSTSAPAKTCTAAGGAISAGQRANGRGSLSGEAASRYGNARSVARARDRAARDGRELAGGFRSGGFASARVGRGAQGARRKAAARLVSRSARGRASRVRTVLCILSLAQYPCVLVGWFQFFFLWTTDATKQARESQRRRRTARRASRDRGRRKEASEAERLPTARSRSVTDFAARTLPRTSPWSPPCAPRSPPAASRDPPSYWRGTE